MSVSAASTVFVYLVQASNRSTGVKTVVSAAAVPGTFVTAFLIMLLTMLILAPARLRDDARRALAEHSGPPVLPVHHIESAQIYITSSGHGHLYAVVACCPRHRRRPITWAVTRESAWAFVAEAFPGTFLPVPAEYGDHLVSFEVPGDGGVDDTWRRRIRIHSGGVIELLWRLPDPAPDPAGPALPLVEMCRPITLLATAVHHGAYARLFPRPFGRRRRMQWFAGAGIGMTLDGNYLRCERIAFPGREPGFRANRAYVATEGYCYDMRQSAAPADLIRLILEDQLRRSGYDDTGGAIDDALAALESSPEAGGDHPTERIG